MPYTPEQVNEYMQYVAKTTGSKYTPEQLAKYRDHVIQTQMSDEKPMVAGLLPESMAGLFPSPKEAAQLRAGRGQAIVPPEPVPEYSPAEEVALGSIAGPTLAGQVGPKALGLMKAGGGLAKSAAKAVWKNKLARYSSGFGIASMVGDEIKKGIKGLIQ